MKVMANSPGLFSLLNFVILPIDVHFPNLLDSQYGSEKLIFEQNSEFRNDTKEPAKRKIHLEKRE